MTKGPDPKVLIAAAAVLIFLVIIILFATFILPDLQSASPGFGLSDQHENKESIDHVIKMTEISGTITDTYGYGEGGLPVTLHVIGSNGKELRTYKETTADVPYPGYYRIGDIDTTGASYGYVTAENTLKGNNTIHGASDNFTLDGPGDRIASVVLHVTGVITTVFSTSVVPDTPALRQTVSWFGNVTIPDSHPPGGIPVTLHLIDRYDNELSTVETTTLPDLPYPGAFVFDFVELPPTFAYAYVTAAWTTRGGTAVSGKSGNYVMNHSRTTTGSIVLQA